MIKLTFDQQLEAAWNFHNIEKAVFEKEIEDLRAENERLREALKPFAAYAKQTPIIYEHHGIRMVLVQQDLLKRLCQAAAVALRENGDD